MKQYLEVLQHILDNGVESDDRTGVGTIQDSTGTLMKFDLQKGFPAVTTKQLPFKTGTGEFIWMMRGSTNVHELSKITFGDATKPNIWTANYEHQGKSLGYTDGEMGPIYGYNLRAFEGVSFKECKGVSFDQLKYLERELKSNSASRRAVATYLNPAVSWDEATLPSCHLLFQFNIENGKLNCSMYQRAGDLFLGIPLNISYYAELTHSFAIILGVEVGVLSIYIANAHIYKNHIEQVKEQLTREPFELPKLVISERATKLLQETGVAAFDELTIEDFQLENYQHHPKLTAPMAV